jgi:hypothetical protein
MSRALRRDHYSLRYPSGKTHDIAVNAATSK